MKKIVYFISLFLLSCTTKEFRISIPETLAFKSPTVELLSENDSVIYTFNLSENNTLKGAVEKPGLYYLKLKKDYMHIPLWLDNQNYLLVKEESNYRIDAPQNPLQQQWNTYLRQQKEIENAYLHAGEEYTNEEVSLEDKVAILNNLDSLFDIKKNLTLEGIQTFSNTPFAYQIAKENLIFLEHDFSYFDKIIQLLEKNNYPSPLKNELFAKYQQMKANQLTGKAPDFEIPDLNGQKVHLSDFRGKYVLVDFWASWCAPCRAKNKELYKSYPELKKQGLEVISISLDDNKQQWFKAVKDDQISWTQLNDPAGFKNSEVRKAYKVNQVPTVYLINPSGEIITVNPTEKEIKSILQE